MVLQDLYLPSETKILSIYLVPFTVIQYISFEFKHLLLDVTASPNSRQYKYFRFHQIYV